MSGVTGASNNNTAISNLFSQTADQIDNPNAAMGKLDFLKMLITKLKYQDPTNPMKDESFVADMAQFSSLEQMANLNETFAQQISNLNRNIISLMLMQNTSQAASILGKNVLIETSAGSVSGIVSSIKFVDGQPMLIVNGQQYDLAKVKEITA